MRHEHGILKPILFLFLLFIVTVSVIFRMIFTSTPDHASNFGGIIMIGPIPIAFGTSPQIISAMLWIGLSIFLLYFLLNSMEHTKTQKHHPETDTHGLPPQEHTVEHTVKGGGIIMIGPIPIIVGTSKRSAEIVIILAIILIILAIILQ